MFSRLAIILASLTLALSAQAQTARTWISALPPKPTPSPTDQVPIVDSQGNPFRAPASAFGGGNGSSSGVPFYLHSPQSANFSIAAADKGKVFEVTTGSSALTVTLPSAATLGNGFSCTIRKADSGAGSVLVNNTLIGVIGHTVEIWCDGTNIISRVIYGGLDGNGNLSISAPGNITFNPGPNSITQLKLAVIVDPNNTNKQVQEDVSAVSPGIKRYNRHPDADTVAVIPYTANTGPQQFITSIGANGQPVSAPSTESDTVPGQFVIGDANAIVTDDGTITSIRVSVASFSGARTIQFPEASKYQNGKAVRIFDPQGAITPATPLTLVSIAADTFGGQTSLEITSSGIVTLIADPITGNWSYSLPGNARSEMPLTALTGASPSITNVANAITLNYKQTLTADTTPTFASNIPDGREINYIVTQDATGGHALLMPNTQVDTGSTGLGLLAIAAAPNAKTWVRLIKNGSIYEASVVASNLTPSVATGGSLTQDAETGVLVTGQTATLIAQGKATGGRHTSASFLASSSRTIKRIDLPLVQVGVIGDTSHRKAAIFADAARITFTGASTTSGSSTVTLGAAGISASDKGAAVTGPGIPSGTYVGSVNTTANTITLSSSRGTNTAVNAGSGAGSGTVTVYGVPGAQIGTASDAILASAITTNEAVSGLTSFLNVSAAITNGTVYHVVLLTDTTSTDSNNYINWMAYSGQNVTGHQTSATDPTSGATWSFLSAGNQGWFALWH